MSRIRSPLGLALALLLAIAWASAIPAGEDCNGNGVPDSTDIAEGTSPDCDLNGIPDECDTEPVFGTQTIDAPTVGVRELHAADLDGDSDPDLLAAALQGDLYVWYENLDGLGSMGPAQVIDQPNGGFGIWADDLDGDSDLDVLAVGFYDHRISLYENLDGAGTFGPEQVVAEANGPTSVRTADLDGDSDPDILATFEQADSIFWYRNLDGAGTFGPEQLISADVVGPQHAFAADLDGDSDLDVLSASFFDWKVAWYENLDGNGSFGPQKLITVQAAGARRVMAADLDGDGDPDVLSTNGDFGAVAWYENLNGNGWFGPPRILSQPGDTPRQADIADLDNDGDLDVVSQNFQSTEVVWFENDGGGEFSAAKLVADDASFPWAVIAVDLDGDLHTDVIAGNTAITWHFNQLVDCDGDGTPDSCQADCNANDLADACEPDCNTNGVADECDIDAGTSGDCGGIGNGIPDECEPDCDGNRIADSCDILAGTYGDCDVDGVPDVCEADCNDNATPDDCDLQLGSSADCDGNGVPDECDIDSGLATDCDGDVVPDACETALQLVQELVGAPAAGLRDVVAADLDGDGDRDVVSASELDDKIAWYETLPGGFGPQQVLTTSADGAQAVDAGDIDGDGDLDLVAASFIDATLAWFENTDGQGTFGSEQAISFGAMGAQDVALVDLDGDLDLDLLAAAALDDAVSWYENTDGNGGFGAEQPIAFSNGVTSVAAADIDGDGDLDVVSSAFSDPRVAWYENTDGAGSFGPQQTIFLGEEGFRSIAVADFDGDGDPDVVAGSPNDSRVTWYENVPGNSGAWSLKVITTTAEFVESVSARDVDGDGDADVLVAAFADDTLTWFENLNGSGQFSSTRLLAFPADGASTIVAADVDADGDIDVLGGGYHDGEILLLRNLSDDCNGNGVPDNCEADCNLNAIVDSCDIRAGFSADCDLSQVPDECEAACPDCNADGDACPDELDCAPADATIWATPGPLDSLRMVPIGASTRLVWNPPLAPGALALRYDTLRSPEAQDFVAPAFCLESDGTNTISVDATIPLPGAPFFYLIRTENDCPSDPGNIGTASDGTPRSAVACP